MSRYRSLVDRSDAAVANWDYYSADADALLDDLVAPLVEAVRALERERSAVLTCVRRAIADGDRYLEALLDGVVDLDED